MNEQKKIFVILILNKIENVDSLSLMMKKSVKKSDEDEDEDEDEDGG